MPHIKMRFISGAVEVLSRNIKEQCRRRKRPATKTTDKKGGEKLGLCEGANTKK